MFCRHLLLLSSLLAAMLATVRWVFSFFKSLCDPVRVHGTIYAHQVSHHHQYMYKYFQSKQHLLFIYLLGTKHTLAFALFGFHSNLFFSFVGSSLMFFYFIFMCLFTHSNLIVLKIFFFIIAIEIDE